MMSKRKTLRVARMASIGLLAGLMTQAAGAVAVKIEFSDSLESRMERINALETKREKEFRKFRVEGARVSLSAPEKMNQTRYGGVDWGNERLFPNIEDYSIPGLFQAMMERGMQAADPDFGGTIKVKINKMRIRYFPLISLTSHSTRIEGMVTVLDAAGNEMASYKVNSSILPEYSTSGYYDGPDYAYSPTSVESRVGPIAAEFTEKVLNKLYPDYDAPGLVVVQ